MRDFFCALENLFDIFNSSKFYKMKILLAFLSLSFYYSLWSQDFTFTLKDAFESTELKENDNGIHTKIHKAGEGMKYLAVIGTVKSKTDSKGQVEDEKIFIKNGEEKFSYVGEFDLDEYSFADRTFGVRYDKDLEWVSLVFLVKKDFTAQNFNLGDISISIPKIGSAPKYAAPKISGKVLDMTLIESVSDEGSYEWKNKEGTKFTEIYKSNHPKGKLLKLKVYLKMEDAPEFLDLGNFYSGNFALSDPNGIATPCIGGGKNGSFHTNYNSNIRPLESDRNDTEIELYFDAGTLNIEKLKNSSLQFGGNKILDLN